MLQQSQEASKLCDSAIKQKTRGLQLLMYNQKFIIIQRLGNLRTTMNKFQPK
ncbi:unnamed protein product [Paramecium octaurelia]|uniref:Uncharacterized protein n=1 Tax=Paramecium octaurelia TaxID=43137 RepID=A0A8S1U6I4_PAROT|nr:unnamed protein product [Paramecium octaurelia]